MALQKEKIQDHRISGTPEINRGAALNSPARVLVELHDRGIQPLHTFGYQTRIVAGRAIMVKDADLVGVLRSAGMALVVAGVLMVVATVLHPSRETATTIIASEVGLVAAHVLYTLSWLLVLLGLPGLYLAQRWGMGRLGLVGFLTAFFGTYLIAVTGNFGFLAPVLAKQSPTVLDSINQYAPVVGVNGLAAITFMVGFALFGIAMIRTASLPRMSGILVAVGAPAHLLGFGIAQFVSPIFWVIAILGSLSLGAGLAWPGYLLWRAPLASNQPTSNNETPPRY
jgi:hypothetical protein